MALNDEVDILRNIPFFSALDLPQLKLIALSCDLVNYSKGEILFREGDKGDTAYILLAGSADVLVGSDEHVIATLEQNALIGEIALLCDVPRTATIRAAEDLKVLCLSKDNFLELLNEFSSIAIGIAKELAERLQKTDSHLKELLAKV